MTNLTNSSQTPKFSVVIPAYNVESYIVECIQSVLDQTETDFEVLVVDDGSLDSTAAKISSFSDPRVRMIQRPNGGLAAARNTGIQSAQGELVAFLDADDRWRAEKLAAHRQIMDEHPDIAVSYDWSTFIDSQGQLTGLNTTQLQIELTPEGLMLKNYLANGSTSVVRRSVLERVGGFDETLRRFVDHELWVRLAFLQYQFKLIPTVLTEYRTHAASFSADTNRMLQGVEAFLAKIATYAPESVEKHASLVRAFTHRWMARAAFVDGNYPKARSHTLQALKNNWTVLWQDHRAPITFAAIAAQSLIPAPVFQRLLPIGKTLLSRSINLQPRSN